jgi:hypothetical protein
MRDYELHRNFFVSMLITITKLQYTHSFFNHGFFVHILFRNIRNVRRYFGLISFLKSLGDKGSQHLIILLVQLCRKMAVCETEISAEN